MPATAPFTWACTWTAVPVASGSMAQPVSRISPRSMRAPSNVPKGRPLVSTVRQPSWVFVFPAPMLIAYTQIRWLPCVTGTWTSKPCLSPAPV